MSGLPAELKGLDRVYVPDQLLGEGAFGKVYKAKDTKDNKPVAIKVIARGEENITEYVRREIINHSQLRHPQVIQFYEVILDSRNMYIVMEYANGGDLFDFMVQRQRVLSEDEARWFFQQLIFGLEYLHKVVHIVSRDLKLENVLIVLQQNSKFPILKICDFGYSKNKLLDSPERSRVGSPAYFAPEVISSTERSTYDGKKADLWACGIMLYTMLFGSYPFAREEDRETPHLQDQKMLQRIMRGEWNLPSRPSTSTGVQEIIRGLIKQDPARRMTIEDIYNHPWFNIHLPDGVKKLNQNATAVEPAQGLDNIKLLVEEARQIPGQQHSDIYEQFLVEQDHQQD